MKKIDAPLAWIERINQPLFTSRWICEIIEKAVEISLEKFIAKNKPEAIWVAKQMPSKEPKFHIYEILDGVGKLINGFINFNISLNEFFNWSVNSI